MAQIQGPNMGAILSSQQGMNNPKAFSINSFVGGGLPEAGLFAVLGEGKNCGINYQIEGFFAMLEKARGTNTLGGKFLDIWKPKEEAWSASPNEMIKAFNQLYSDIQNEKPNFPETHPHNPGNGSRLHEPVENFQPQSMRGGSMLGGNNSSNNSGDSGNSSGSNHSIGSPFSSMANFGQGINQMQYGGNVPAHMLGGIAPSPTPGIGGRGAGITVGGGF